MSHSEFGHKLRRICFHRPTRRVSNTKPVPPRRSVRHDMPSHASVEMLWRGPGINAPDDEP